MQQLTQYLQIYPDKKVAREISDGFTKGFTLQYTGPRQSVSCTNLISAEQHSNELRQKIAQEISLGRIAGPYINKPLHNLHISPIGAILKPGGGCRLITNLSFPPNRGINDYIDPEISSVKYTSFDKVIDMISEIGKGALIGKMDIKSAFRLLPVFPGDFDLLGFKFDNYFFVDKSLPMGCRISCCLFEKFATFLHWLVEFKSGLKTLDHYLDDYIFAGKRFTNQCQQLMLCFTETCQELGVPLAENKAEGPVTVMTFLGLEINTEKMLIKIPPKKITELSTLLEQFLVRKKITLKELQSLTGVLMFFCKAIRAGRAFIRRFYDAMCGVKKLHHYIRVNSGMLEDMKMWQSFLSDYNGISYFPERNWSFSDTIELFTDAAGSADLGCGAYFSGRWVFWSWLPEWKDSGILKDVTFLEMIPILIAVKVWGPMLVNKKILFRVDNLALVHILNKQTSKSKRIMDLIRQFVLHNMKNNIIWRSVHISGLENGLADAISRREWQRFFKAAPDAEKEPETVPKDFLQWISSVK